MHDHQVETEDAYEVFWEWCEDELQALEPILNQCQRAGILGAWNVEAVKAGNRLTMVDVSSGQLIPWERVPSKVINLPAVRY